MKETILVLLVLLLRWNTANLDVDGQPLSAGNEVVEYKVYGCKSNNCNPSNAVFIATIPAEVPQKATLTLDITGLSRPQSYFVTAINVSGEAAPSNVIRVTPAKSIDGVTVEQVP